MKTKLLLLLLVISSAVEKSQAQIITTVCGNGTAGYTGIGVQATAAELNTPAGIVFDASGNLYFSDAGNNMIRMVNTAGIINSIIGNGVQSFSGDGGPATTAELYNPFGVAFDAFGNLYIADEGNNRIRKVNAAGIIHTVAGDSLGGNTGDGGQATVAELYTPEGVTLDAAGNMYIADYNNNRIRMVNTAGVISTLVGTGSPSYGGDGGPASAAGLFHPTGTAFDGAGNLYISDYQNLRIRKVNTLGIISTYAGNGSAGHSGDGGPATSAELYHPQGIAFDALGNMYIADYTNNRIRMVNTAGIISTIAGNGIIGYSGDGGVAIAAELFHPTGVAVDATGSLYIVDDGNNVIRKVTNPSSLGIQQLANNKVSMSIYPNPATNSLQISFSGNSEGSTLVMTDMLGNTVKQTTFSTQHTTFNINDVEAGVYFITLTSGATISTQKVIVSR